MCMSEWSEQILIIESLKFGSLYKLFLDKIRILTPRCYSKIYCMCIPKKYVKQRLYLYLSPVKLKTDLFIKIIKL